MYNNVRERGGSKGNFLLRDEFSLGSRSLDSGLDTTMKEDERTVLPRREVRCTNTWNGEGEKKSGERERERERERGEKSICFSSFGSPKQERWSKNFPF